MAQNRSTAVMQRRVEPPDSLDYFPTPPWATRALCERLTASWPLHMMEAWEPACGAGHMARPLGEYFDRVTATDVHDYRADYPGQSAVQDFLLDWPGMGSNPDWIITNPPFRLAQEFITTGLSRARIGVAVLVRSAFLEAQGRYRDLFAPYRPALILQFVERVAMVKGQLDKNASSATSYCWVIWTTEKPEMTALDWIPVCRARLERPGDYPAAETAPPGGMFAGVGA